MQQHVVQLDWNVGCTKQSGGESGQEGGCGQIMEGLSLAGACQSMSCNRLVSWSGTSGNGKAGYVRKSRSLVKKLELKEAKQICFMPHLPDPPRGQRSSQESAVDAILMTKTNGRTLETDQARRSHSALWSLYLNHFLSLPSLRLCYPHFG